MKTKYVIGTEPAAQIWLNILITRTDLVSVVARKFELDPSFSFSGKREIENLLKSQIIAYGAANMREPLSETARPYTDKAGQIIDRYFPEFR